MKVLLAAINAKYIHSNLGIYSLKTYGEKMLKEWGLAEQAEISLAEYTINHQMEQILQDIYKRKPDVIGFSCYIWNISYVKVMHPSPGGRQCGGCGGTDLGRRLRADQGCSGQRSVSGVEHGAGHCVFCEAGADVF